jgi:hypothetical protein
MKFLALRDALVRALRPAEHPPAPAPPPPAPPTYQLRRVENNVVNLKPVDRVAARVISPASWLHRPPPTQIKMDIPSDKPEDVGRTPLVRTKVAFNSKGQAVNSLGEVIDMKVGRDAHGNAIDPVTKEPLTLLRENSHIASELGFREALQVQNERIKQLKDSYTAVTETMESLVVARERLRDMAKQISRETMESRMHTVSEVHQLLSAMKDIRQWFIGPDYQQEMTRLREFLGLCEQLRKLKEDGTLDAVSETILKLAFGSSK